MKASHDPKMLTLQHLSMTMLDVSSAYRLISVP